jgi:hypothetical protein
MLGLYFINKWKKEQVFSIPISTTNFITPYTFCFKLQWRYPATHNNLMDLEDQNQNVIPGAWRNDKVLLDVYHERARNTGIQEGRQIRQVVVIFLHVSGLWFMVLSKTRNLCARIPKAFSTTRLALESL